MPSVTASTAYPLSPALIIFIQNPDKGKVKPRLAADLGEDTALAIHNQLLNHTRSITQSIEAEKYLYYSDYPNWNDAWPIADYRKRLQQGPDLTDRIAAAFESIFEEDHSKAILITGDSQELSTRHIIQAFEALDKVDLVIGPAHSGSPYLLGTKSDQLQLLTNIDWSKSEALQDALAIAVLSGLSIHLLPTLHTINTPADLAQSGLAY